MQRVKPYLVRGWLPTKLNMGVHVVINETALEKIMTEERMDEYNMVSTLKTRSQPLLAQSYAYLLLLAASTGPTTPSPPLPPLRSRRHRQSRIQNRKSCSTSAIRSRRSTSSRRQRTTRRSVSSGSKTSKRWIR